VIGYGCTAPCGLLSSPGSIRPICFSPALATSQQAQHNHDDQTVLNLHRAIAFLWNFDHHGI
jgi:hypothetical protein